MFYLQYGIILFLLMLAYVWFAKKYSIIDRPNERSSHNTVVVRGAGVVFPLSLIVYQVTFSQYYPNFHFVFAGAMLISLVSFIDDLKPLPVSIRLPVHLISVCLLLYGFDTFSVLSWWTILLFIVIMMGIINAYNFMDGINGITALYSLVSFSTLWYIIKYVEHIESTAFVNYGIVSCLVFLFFNFRKQARCFLGDVGSIGLGFWIVAALCYVIFHGFVFEYILLLSVYLIDTGFTFVQRLLNGENVSLAHRKHLYQILVNENKWGHLWVATLYSAIQFSMNVFVLLTDWALVPTTIIVIVPFSTIYILVKRKFIIQSRKELASKLEI